MRIDVDFFVMKIAMVCSNKHLEQNIYRESNFKDVLSLINQTAVLNAAFTVNSKTMSLLAMINVNQATSRLIQAVKVINSIKSTNT